ncbi:MAG: ATP synthase F1 subunit epsilon [Planctomycetota bacterium]|jgi:F-type H+-transporting ATPase subunit epsilon|nr:ATP synthase F1 subunit epsilon [Planctomycetota bacterium]
MTAAGGRAKGELHCRVLTPEKNVYDDFVDSAVLATAAGELEVFPRFEPTVSPLAVGVMRAKGGDGSVAEVAIHGGYLDMNGKSLLILADSAEMGGEINVERARRALARARQQLAEASEKAEAAEVDRARLALLRALTRLRAAGAE